MTANFCFLLCSTVAIWGCAGGITPGSDSPRAGCQSGVVPAGHWVGEWQTYALSHPELARSGTLDVVIASSGKLTGSSAESDNPDLGALTGVVKPTGEFSADSVVIRSGHEAKYKLTGTLACEGTALAGAGTSTWGSSDKGSLKFRLERAE
ncbi:MAG: hypothetical protein IT377_33470 [Polyangiaceae bacterium]|nr:hypothetical protein [Polyangiaceae bacterium]